MRISYDIFIPRLSMGGGGEPGNETRCLVVGNESAMFPLALNPGSPFWILSRFFSKAARQNPEQRAWVRG